MVRHKILLILIAILLSVAPQGFSATVILKSGKQQTGDIITRARRYIVLKADDRRWLYYHKNIDQIIESEQKGVADTLRISALSEAMSRLSDPQLVSVRDMDEKKDKEILSETPEADTGSLFRDSAVMLDPGPSATHEDSELVSPERLPEMAQRAPLIPLEEMIPVRERLGYTLPGSWRSLGVDAQGAHGFETSFDITEKTIGFIRSFPDASYSAHEWARNEANNLSRSGIEITSALQTDMIGQQQWVWFFWEGKLAYQGTEDVFGGVQYYAKIDTMIVEVLLSAPKDVFAHVDQKEIYAFLSSVKPH